MCQNSTETYDVTADFAISKSKQQRLQIEKAAVKCVSIAVKTTKIPQISDEG
jgi:hypothetical protein